MHFFVKSSIRVGCRHVDAAGRRRWHAGHAARTAHAAAAGADDAAATANAAAAAPDDHGTAAG